MNTDRHPKWTPVEPGTLIAEGQPYRVEYTDDVAYEANRPRSTRTVPEGPTKWFIDSSWRPPLELPTAPAWGIAVNSMRREFGRWMVDGIHLTDTNSSHSPQTFMHINTVSDFIPIPLTPEQVARIEDHK